MKRTLISAGVGALCALAQPATAANWVHLLGTEPANTGKFQPFGFIQPTYTYYDAEPMQGGNAQINGKYQFQNLVQPTYETKEQFQLFRAQFGARGNLTDKLNYFVLTDLGKNLTTVQHEAMITDASATLSFIPGARIRAGLFKLPTSEEALVPNPTSYSYVYYSFVGSTLVQETPYQTSAGTGCTALAGAATLNCAKAVAGNNAFRDWGIQVFDTFTRDKWEFGYAAMLSNGGEIENMGDSDSDKDFTWKLQASYLFGGKGVAREDVNAFIWRQNGDRRFGATDYNRTREGVGARYLKGPLRVTGEYIRGDGMIPAGPNPPVPNANGLVPPYNLNIAPMGKADGWYLEAGWKFHPNWEIEARYDEYDRNTNDPAANRLFQTWTLGTQYFFNKNTRLTLNFEWREQKVPYLGAITNAAQQTNAVVVADNFANRASVQLTWSF